MAEPVANEGEPSSRPPDSAYEDYLLARGLRYLTPCKHQRKQLFNQFLQLFTSAFKIPDDRAPHGHLWGIDIRVIDYLIDPICLGHLPGIEVRINAGQGTIPRISPEELAQRPDPAFVVLFSSLEDENTTVRLLCKHILNQATKAYDRKLGTYKGFWPGKKAPWVIGFIEVCGLYINGAYDLPKHVKRTLKKVAKLPAVANLIIDNLCDCHPPARVAPAPAPKTTSKPLVRVEVHNPQSHQKAIDRDKCYLCSPFSAFNRERNPITMKSRLEMAKKANEVNDVPEYDAENSVSNARQTHMADDAEQARHGTQAPRPAATAVTEAAKKDAIKFTINALVDAGYPIDGLDELFGENGPLDVADILREMNLGGAGVGAGIDHGDGDTKAGKGKGKAKEYGNGDNERAEDRGKGKEEGNAKDIHNVAHKGGPTPARPVGSASGHATALPTITITRDSEAEAGGATAASTVIQTGLTKTQKRAALRRAKKQLAREAKEQE